MEIQSPTEPIRPSTTMAAGINNECLVRTSQKLETYGYQPESEAQSETGRPLSGSNRTRHRAKQEQHDLERAMEESLQDIPVSSVADEGVFTSRISCQPTSVNNDPFAAANNAFMAAAAKPGSATAVPKADCAAKATVAQGRPKAKRRQSGSSPPAKRRKAMDAKHEHGRAVNQSVATATNEARLTRQTFQEQAKTFVGKEEKYYQESQKTDHLAKLPPAGREYVRITKTHAPELRISYADAPYTIYENHARHPKLIEAEKRQVITTEMASWYKHMNPGVNIPVAGIPLDKRLEMQAREKTKASLKKARTMKEAPNATVAPVARRHCTRSVVKPSSSHAAVPQSASSHDTVPQSSTPDIPCGPQEFIEEATKAMAPPVQAPQTPSGVKQALSLSSHLAFEPLSFVGDVFRDRAKRESSEQEEAFYARPSIKIIIPDMLKGLLVDDWENVTKNNQLVPIPHPKPVSKVMDDYLAYEKPRRTEGSAAIDILEETVAGLKEYFDKSLGRILLYRFERAQYAEIREKWTSGGPDVQGKTPCDTYGAEHLMRLITSLPELIAQTNMDQQSVNRLREELSKFCQWLERNAGAYFVNEYESPNAEYAEKAKN
ncbi:MRG-domain-containing protein [Apiospora sp. TS-2023a]